MRVADLFPAVCALSAIANAQHVHYVIPEVDQIVQYMSQVFEPWINNYEPRPHPNPPSPTSTSPPSPSQTASCSYWLENIKHQGVSAFNTDTNYTVFRNVKDYGAKGVNIHFFLCSQFRSWPATVFHFYDGEVNSQTNC
jgi:glucan 1,3-beta-glucosidase